MHGTERLCLNRTCATNGRRCNPVLQKILTLAGDFVSISPVLEAMQDKEDVATRLLAKSESEGIPQTESQPPVLGATLATGVLFESTSSMLAEVQKPVEHQWIASRDLALYAAARKRQHDEIVWTQKSPAKKQQKKR